MALPAANTTAYSPAWALLDETQGKNLGQVATESLDGASLGFLPNLEDHAINLFHELNGGVPYLARRIRAIFRIGVKVREDSWMWRAVQELRRGTEERRELQQLEQKVEDVVRRMQVELLLCSASEDDQATHEILQPPAQLKKDRPVKILKSKHGNMGKTGMLAEDLTGDGEEMVKVRFSEHKTAEPVTYHTAVDDVTRSFYGNISLSTAVKLPPAAKERQINGPHGQVNGAAEREQCAFELTVAFKYGDTSNDLKLGKLVQRFVLRVDRQPLAAVDTPAFVVVANKTPRADAHDIMHFAPFAMPAVHTPPFGTELYHLNGDPPIDDDLQKAILNFADDQELLALFGDDQELLALFGDHVGPDVEASDAQQPEKRQRLAQSSPGPSSSENSPVQRSLAAPASPHTEHTEPMIFRACSVAVDDAPSSHRCSATVDAPAVRYRGLGASKPAASAANVHTQALRADLKALVARVKGAGELTKADRIELTELRMRCVDLWG